MKLSIKSTLLMAVLAASLVEAKVPNMQNQLPVVHDSAIQLTPDLMRQVAQANNFQRPADRWEPVKLLGASIISSIGVYGGIGHVLNPMLRRYTNAHQDTCAQWSGSLASATWLAALVSGCSLTSLIQWPSDHKARKYAWAGLIGSALVGTASATAFVYGINKRAL